MKKAYIALIRDVEKGTPHLEAIPQLFDGRKSVQNYAEHRLNERVTVVVKIQEIEVEDDVKLISWP